MKEFEPAKRGSEARERPAERTRAAPRRREWREEETPLLVEMAWLVIEAATAVARLRRILARL